MENFWEHKLTTNVKNLRLKRGVIPHLFHCQNRNLSETTERSAVRKRKQMELVAEALNDVISQDGPSSSYSSKNVEHIEGHLQNKMDPILVNTPIKEEVDFDLKTEKEHSSMSLKGGFEFVGLVNEPKDQVATLCFTEFQNENLTVDTKLREECGSIINLKDVKACVVNEDLHHPGKLVYPMSVINFQQEDPSCIQKNKTMWFQNFSMQDVLKSTYSNDNICDKDMHVMIKEKSESPHGKVKTEVVSGSFSITDYNSKTYGELCQPSNTKEEIDVKNHDIGGSEYNVESNLTDDSAKEYGDLCHFSNMENKIGVKNLDVVHCNLNKTGTVVSGLMIPMIVHSRQKPYSSDVCNKPFTNYCTFKSHILHTSKRQYHCDVCKKTFTRYNYLKGHIIVHTGERPYCCDICNKRFALRRHLKSHILLHTGEKPYSCDICNKTFTYCSHLKSHILLHTGEKPYACDICNKTFTRHSHLKVHIMKHTGEKPYCCDVCNKSFTQLSNLKTHMLIHIGKKPYCCVVCNETFTLRGNLKRHISLHTGDKHFCCNVSNKAFTQNNRLRSHIFLHTGQKPYICIVCNKTFINRSSLRRHITLHIGEKLYACKNKNYGVCNKTFSQHGN